MKSAVLVSLFLVLQPVAEAAGRYAMDVRILDLESTELEIDGKATSLAELGSFHLHGAFSSIRSGSTLVTVGDADVLVDGSPDGPRLIAAPRVETLPGEEAQIMTGKALHYFEREEDGRFALRVTGNDDSPILRLSLTPRPAEDGTVAIEGGLHVGLLSGREPIPDVPLDVGRPIIVQHDFPFSMSLEPDAWGLLTTLRTRGDDGEKDLLLFLIKVTVL